MLSSCRSSDGFEHSFVQFPKAIKLFIVRPRIEPSSIPAMVTVVTAVVMALVTIATVAIVLGWVVVRRVGWCYWGGRRIQTNNTATIRINFIKERDGSADDAVFASKVLQESSHLVRVSNLVPFESTKFVLCHRASSLRVCDVRVLQGVEHWTNIGAHRRNTRVLSNVSVLVDGKLELLSFDWRVISICALDLNWVAWELAELILVFVACWRLIDNARGVDGGAKLGGNVRNLGSRVLERIMSMVRLVVVVVGAVRVVGRCDATVSRRRGLVALGLRVLRRVVSALRLVVGLHGGLVIRMLMGVGWPMEVRWLRRVGKSATVLSVESGGSRGKNGESETLHYDFIFKLTGIE